MHQGWNNPSNFHPNGLQLLKLQEYFTDYICFTSTGVPAVITLSPLDDLITQDGVPVAEACRVLEEKGATVVGLNCSMGLESMVTAITDVRKACKVCIRYWNILKHCVKSGISIVLNLG